MATKRQMEICTGMNSEIENLLRNWDIVQIVDVTDTFWA